MSTVAQTVDAVRGELLGYTREARNLLDAAYVAGSGTMTLRYDADNVASGARLSADLNTFHVWDRNAQVLTVAGGQEGTVDANVADGTTVWVNPKWTAAQVLDALNAELSSLSSPVNGLFQVATYSFAYAMGMDAFDLPVDPQSIIDVRVELPTGRRTWHTLAGHEWSVIRGADVGDFPSGRALRLHNGTISGRSVEVLYRTGFATLSGLAQDVAGVSGLPSTALDLLRVGAQIRLVAGVEVARNFLDAEGQPRRAEEVPQGAVLRSWAGLAKMRRQRIEDERSLLLARYPPRRWM